MTQDWDSMKGTVLIPSRGVMDAFLEFWNSFVQPIQWGPQTVQASQLSHTFREPNLVLCRFAHYQPRVGELSLAQVSCFCGYHHHGLDPFAHIIAPPSPGLVSGSSAQCFFVDICICFHHLLKILWWQLRKAWVWLQGKVSLSILSTDA